MPMLDLSIDELLTTTRAVRQRLDLTRPVEGEAFGNHLWLHRAGEILALAYSASGGQQFIDGKIEHGHE